MAGTLAEIWDQAVSSLRGGSDGEASAARWLSMVRPLSQDHAEDGCVLHVGVPNAFVLDWIKKRYLPAILDELRARTGCKVSVRLRVDGKLFQKLRAEQRLKATESQDVATSAPAGRMVRGTPGEDAGAQTGATVDARSSLGRTVPVSAPCGTRFTLSGFAESRRNRTVVSAIREVLKHPGERYNPLVLHGPTGVGKTHLLRAAHVEFMQLAPRSRARFVDADSFVGEFVGAAREGTLSRFRRQYRQLDLLIVDDIQVLARKTGTQDEFLHALDALSFSGCQIIVSSRGDPRKVSGLARNLVGRLVAGLILAVEPPDRAARRLVLEQRNRGSGACLGAEVLDFIATNVRGTAREVLGAFHEVAVHAAAHSGPVDESWLAEVLAETLRAQRARVTPEGIVEGVGRYYRIRPVVLRSRNRQRRVSLARQVAVFLCREMTELSFGEIGRLLGNRTASSARAADRAIRKPLESGSGVPDGVCEVLELMGRDWEPAEDSVVRSTAGGARPGEEGPRGGRVERRRGS